MSELHRETIIKIVATDRSMVVGWEGGRGRDGVTLMDPVIVEVVTLLVIVVVIGGGVASCDRNVQDAGSYVGGGEVA